LISWYEMQSYMIPMLLRDSDQMSMAVGLEIRVPFLDHCLVEEALTLPQQYKMGKGVKPLLVEAFKDELPREVYDRPKQGFALPMEDWIRGPLARFTSDGVQAAADWLGLAEPLQQKTSFDKGNLHWTRVWHWAVLGHWLTDQKSPGRSLASVA
jgi:asparagine synthase (glutamine-hydrolysing)